VRRVVAVLLAMWLPGRPAHSQAPAVAPYRVTWWDAASLAGAGAMYLLPAALHLPHGGPSCAPCDPATVPGIDRWMVRPVSSVADAGSGVALAAVAGWTAWAGLGGLPAAQARGNAVVFANAAGWSAAASEWLKVLVHRKRPVLYTAGAPAAAGDRDNLMSFPSTHVALAFSAATAYLVMSARERLPHRHRNALLLYAGAAVVGALRIAAAKHFPTDVAGGALLGAGLGWLAPTMQPTLR
jgi:undecaprenyl-diphosphatase